MQVSDKPLTCLANTHSGEYLAVGSDSGSCAVLQLSKSMWTSPKEEKASINAMFEREGLRCASCYASLLQRSTCANPCVTTLISHAFISCTERKIGAVYHIYADQLRV